MNQIRKFLVPLLAATMIVFAASPLILTGCKSPPGKIAYNAVAVSAVSADTAIHMWADYVAAQKIAGTPVPLEQEIQAKHAWNSFQDARDAVIKAGVVYSSAKADPNAAPGALGTLNAAVAAMTAASADLLSLIQSFGVKLN